jgi:hypothetical protein
MKPSISRRLFTTLALSLLVILSVSSAAMGQGRGRRVSQWDKKCAKFVNCHDARDGRLDGRGPDRDRNVTNRFFRRHRRNRDNDVIRRRGRDRDRDFDQDRRWRHRR